MPEGFFVGNYLTDMDEIPAFHGVDQVALDLRRDAAENPWPSLTGPLAAGLPQNGIFRLKI